MQYPKPSQKKEKLQALILGESLFLNSFFYEIVLFYLEQIEIFLNRIKVPVTSTFYIFDASIFKKFDYDNNMRIATDPIKMLKRFS